MTPGVMRGLPGEGSLLSQQFGPGTRWARRKDEAGRTSTTNSRCLTSPLGDGMRMIERRGDGGWRRRLWLYRTDWVPKRDLPLIGQELFFTGDFWSSFILDPEI
jgi:hypothetical protein